jgi:preprotein translocase subunit SecD
MLSAPHSPAPPPSPRGRAVRYALAVLTVIACAALVFLLMSLNKPAESAIDRQGGIRVTLTAHTFDDSPPTPDALSLAQKIIRARLTGLGFTDPQIVATADTLTVTVPGNRPDELENLGQKGRLEIRPVVHAVPAAPTPSEGDGPTATPTAAPPDLGQRIAEEKNWRQSPSPGVQVLSLQYEATRCGLPDILAGNDDPSLPLATCSTDHKTAYLLGPSIISGNQIQDAGSSFSQGFGSYLVSLKFTSAATGTWAEFTAAHIGTQMAFTVDTRVVSAPEIREAIPSGKTQIAGGQPPFTADGARALANTLKYGSLPVAFQTSKPEVIAPRAGSVGPRLTHSQFGLVISTIGLLIALLGTQAYLYRARIRTLLPHRRARM